MISLSVLMQPTHQQQVHLVMVLEGTSVEVDTHNLTALIGYQPNQNWNFYAGPVYQTVEGKVSLRGAAYGGTRLLGGYDIDLKRR